MNPFWAKTIPLILRFIGFVLRRQEERKEYEKTHRIIEHDPDAESDGVRGDKLES